MNREHLQDEDFQLLLDGIAGERTVDIEEHLAECADCARSLEEYRLIWTALTDESEFVLPADFTDKVVAQVDLKPLTVKEPVSYSLYALVASLVGLVSILHFYTNIFSQTGAVALGFVSKFGSWFGGLSIIADLIQKSPIRLDLVGAAFAVLIVYGALDKIQKNLRRHRATMFIA